MNYLLNENIESILELSPVQKEIAAVSSKGKTENLNQLVIELDRVPNIEWFKKSWNFTVQNTTNLRSIIRLTKNRNIQVVLKERPIDLLILEGHNFDDIQRDDFKEGFVISEGPLARATILLEKLNNKAYFIFTYHSIVIDEYSANMICSTLLSYYNNLFKGITLDHSTGSDNKNYINWINEQDWSKGESFFEKRFQNLIAPSGLPTVLSTNNMFDGQSKSKFVELTDSLNKHLEKIYRINKTDILLYLHTAWAILCQLYSNNDAVSLGVKVDSRFISDNQKFIGSLENTMISTLNLNVNMKMSEVIQLIKNEQYELLNYSYLSSFSKMSTSEKSNFLSSISFRDSNHIILENISGKIIGSSQHLNHPLHISLIRDDTWKIEFRYLNDVLSDNTLDRIYYHLSNVLSNMLNNENQTIKDLSYLAQDEKYLLEKVINKSLLPEPNLEKFVHNVFEEQVEKNSEKIATIFNNEGITYKNLNERANKLAHWLRDNNFGRNDIAAICCERSIEMQIAILAVLKAGGAYLPLDHNVNESRNKSIIEKSRIKIFLTSELLLTKGLNLVSTMKVPILLINSYNNENSYNDQTNINIYNCRSTEKYPCTNLNTINEPNDLANIFYTSGSTGEPKGAMVEHLGMLNHLWAKINICEISKHSRLAQNASHCFDISVWQFLAPLMVGGQVVIYKNSIAQNPILLMQKVLEDQISVIEIVPSIMEAIVNQNEIQSLIKFNQKNSLKVLIATGEGLPIDVCEKWLKIFKFTKVINAYGLSETSDDFLHEIVTSSTNLNGINYVSLGKVIPNCKVYILDINERILPIGCIGEIHVTGIPVGTGYLHNEEQTSRVYKKNIFNDGMVDRMYKTGDLGYISQDGKIHYVSRKDNQVKIRGNRIELGEIEIKLREHPLVNTCITIIRQNNDNQDELLSYVTGKNITKSELTEFLIGKIPNYMIPNHIIILEKLPLNQNGKIDRKALPSPEETLLNSNIIVPENDVEKKIISIWSNILGISESKISTTDNFFELGGHSLRLLKMRSRIIQEFNKNLSLEVLFENNTIKKLSLFIINESTDIDTKTQIESLGNKKFYTLSHAQKRLFFLSRLEPDNPSYNMSLALRFTGSLDGNLLYSSLIRLINSHSSLRTIFQMKDGIPVQKILSSNDKAIEFMDISVINNNGNNKEKEIKQHITNFSNMRFDLEEKPPFKVQILKIDENSYTMIIVMHHIISDLWSWNILLEELSSNYNLALKNKFRNSNEKIRYVDFASWQNDQINSEKFNEAENFWFEQFKDGIVDLNLPVDFRNIQKRSYDGDSESFEIDENLCKKIYNLLDDSETTLHMFILASLGLFLSKLSNQDEVVIGTPEAGRNRIEVENIIGFFINTLPMKIKVEKNIKFLDFLQKVKEISIKSYEYNEYPFDKLIEKLNPIRTLGHSPLFKVMFQVQQDEEATIIFDNVDYEQLPTNNNKTPFDLNFTFIRSQNSLVCNIDYSTELFKKSTIVKMQRNLITLLNEIVNFADKEVSNLSIIGEKEKNEILFQWNDTEHDLENRKRMNICNLFEKNLLEHQDNCSLEHNGTKITYKELNKKANQLAFLLRKKGVQKGDYIGISVDSSLNRIICLLGTLKAGGVFIPLDPEYPKERLEYMLSNSETRHLITLDDLSDKFSSFTGNKIFIDKIILDNLPSENLIDIDIQGEDLAYIIYTSGSTGKPKGVKLKHNGLVNLVLSQIEKFYISEESKILHFASFSFDASVLEIFTSLISGATLQLTDKETLLPGKELQKTLILNNITVVTLPPSILLTLSPVGLDNLKTLIVAGESCSIQLAKKWSVNRKFINAYGPTEATVCTTMHEYQGEDIISIGKPIDNMKVYILDDQQNPVPIGVLGTLYISGIGLSMGYLNQIDLTQSKFIKNPFSKDQSDNYIYNSGDIARYLSNGEIEYIGRNDDLIKLRGFRIELGEIQSVLVRHPLVENAHVIVKDFDNTKLIMAYIVSKENDINIIPDLRTYVTEVLPSYMRPSSLNIIDEIPLTINGKVNKEVLLKMNTKKPIWEETNEMTGEIEQKMLSIWQEVLQTKSINMNDDFFLLGGHSLQALSLIDKINKVFNIELTVSVLFLNSKFHELCSFIKNNDEFNIYSCLVEIKNTDIDSPPLFLIHPHGGGVFCYNYLCNELDINRSIYGLQAPGFETLERPLDSIKEMAKRYVEEIYSVQKDGPFYIAGWSSGGLVAYEIAKVLERENKEIGFIGLIDTPAVWTNKFHGSIQSDGLHELVKYLGKEHLLQEKNSSKMLETLRDEALEKGVIKKGDNPDSLKRVISVINATGIAVDNYDMENKIKSDLYLFSVSNNSSLVNDSDLYQAWNYTTEGKCEQFNLEGDHYSIMEPPYVKDLASKLSTIIRSTVSPFIKKDSEAVPMK